VEDLAEQAGMSSRHFARAFIAETGTTPSKAVERLRIEVARQRVQSSSEAIERVAQLTGFRDPERMRRAFIRAFGQPPQSLRSAARALHPNTHDLVEVIWAASCPLTLQQRRRLIPMRPRTEA
jgi:transcriptional regulator GlxA family with amidase domain